MRHKNCARPYSFWLRRHWKIDFERILCSECMTSVSNNTAAKMLPTQNQNQTFLVRMKINERRLKTRGIIHATEELYSAVTKLWPVYIRSQNRSFLNYSSRSTKTEYIWIIWRTTFSSFQRCPDWGQMNSD